ncbi:MAG: nucleoside:proton symporter [Gammaproteobacteria bacterium]|nr:nucleoside:proton symporter [Gammaproteobacteria bacterium]
MAYFQATLGIIAFIGIAVALSEKRRLPSWRLIAGGLGLQFLFAWLVFRFEFVQAALRGINQLVQAITTSVETGTAFVFGYLGGDPGNVAYPFELSDANATVILAFRILPLILFVTAFSAVLWHLRILPALVRAFSYVLRRSLGVGGAVGLSAAANVFMGMVESPALIRPCLRSLTRSELFIVMTCGMATVAGSVLVLYSVVLQEVLDNALGHVLTASVISAPAAIMLAAIMVPETGSSSADDVELRSSYQSMMDAVTKGTGDGLRLMLNVGAMLIVLIALVALINSLLALLPQVGGQDISLQGLFGWLFAPLVWLMGIPWSEAPLAGSLMGTKTVLNELLAYFALAELPAGTLGERSTVILTYALCGFANFGSLGIMIAGLSGMCPERGGEIVELAMPALVSGTLATCMTGAVAGLLV